MSSFFSKYPKLTINNKIVTDIVTRIAIREKYSNALSLYYPYDIQEGDTPEIIAAKYYGDPERHWIVMLANDTINPFFDFTLDYPVFNRYIMDKYKAEANSINQWANSTWRGEWSSQEYAIIDGVIYPENESVVTYNENHTLEYLYNANTGVTTTVIEGGINDIDVINHYYAGNTVVTSNTAFICNVDHRPTTFKSDLANKYWTRILDGVYWKDTWQNNTQYDKDDVVKHNDTIYICKQNNTSNTMTGITYSNANYWKTYNNAIEYALVTTNKHPFSYRAIITTTDILTGKSTEEKIFIDEKSYNGGLNGYANSIFNFAEETVQADNIEISTSKERLSIYDYEQELNENKRSINLIRKEYVSQLEQELKYLMRKYYG
jgi:hypothetical protein